MESAVMPVMGAESVAFTTDGRPKAGGCKLDIEWLNIVRSRAGGILMLLIFSLLPVTEARLSQYLSNTPSLSDGAFPALVEPEFDPSATSCR